MTSVKNEKCNKRFFLLWGRHLLYSIERTLKKLEVQPRLPLTHFRETGESPLHKTFRTDYRHKRTPSSCRLYNIFLANIFPANAQTSLEAKVFGSYLIYENECD
jgi:hypothetical protein